MKDPKLPVKKELDSKLIQTVFVLDKYPLFFQNIFKKRIKYTYLQSKIRL